MTKGKFTIVRCEAPGFEAVAASSQRALARHMHDQFGIGVVVAGAQKSISGRGMVEAWAGDTITVNPGEIHDGAPIGDAGRAWKMLYLEPAIVAEAVGHISQGRKGIAEFTSPVFQTPSLATHFHQLFAALTNGAGQSPMHREELLLQLLAATMCGKDEPGDQGVPAAVRYARELIDDDPSAPLMLADLAQASGLSRFQVLRAFAKATGLTPHAYLIQRRVQLARRLILRGMPLAQVAADSGFADQSHMTRLFLRQYGISPGMYADIAG